MRWRCDTRRGKLKSNRSVLHVQNFVLLFKFLLIFLFSLFRHLRRGCDQAQWQYTVLPRKTLAILDFDFAEKDR